MLVHYKSLVDLLEKIDEMGGAYDYMPEGYQIVLNNLVITPAFQFVDDENVQLTIAAVANHYALKGDATGLGMFSFLILHWDTIKTGDEVKLQNVLSQLS